MIGSTISHFRILEKLGEGGMGIVYKAQDTRLLRTVAIKVLPPEIASHEEGRQRLVQEARAASSLNHPNICTVHDVGEEGGIHFIVMEWVDGHTLRQILEEKGPFAEQRVVEIGIEVCEALKVAHAAGIIHRDLKPDNIMISEDGLVKVMDFGLASFTYVASTNQKNDVSNHDLIAKQKLLEMSASSIQGTASYMAPEQILGKDIDERTDIFALGVVLYELKAGLLPFVGEDNVAIMKSIINDEPKLESCSEISDELKVVLAHCLAKKPQNRFEEMGECQIELRRFFPTPIKKPTKHIAITAMALLTLLLLFVAFIGISPNETMKLYSNNLREFPRIDMQPIAMHLSGISNLSPIFHPDSEHLVYFHMSTDDSSLSLISQNIESAKITELYRLTDLTSAFFGSMDLSKDLKLALEYRKKGIYLLDASGTKPKLIVDFGHNPKWSPDASKLLFISTSSQFEANDIHIYDFESQALEKISPSNGLQFTSPTWSPDGRWILCLGGLGSNKEIWLIDVSTKEATRLSDFDKFIVEVVWSDDIERIYFNTGDLWQIRFDKNIAALANEPVKLTQGQSIVDIKLSPKGDRLLLVQNMSNQRIERVSLARASEAHMNQPIMISGMGSIVDFDLSADGMWLIAEVVSKDRSLIIISTVDGSWKPLYAKQASFSPAWSADGKWIAFDAGGGDSADIWQIPALGGEAELLIEHPGADWLPTYSPDGKRLCFLSNRSGQFDLWILDLATGNTSQLTNSRGTESRGTWSHDASKLAFFQNADEGNDARIVIYDFAENKFDTILDIPQSQLNIQPYPNVEILAKIAWSVDDDKLYYALHNDLGLIEVDIAKKTTSSFLGEIEQLQKVGNRLFAISGPFVYYLTGESLDQLVITSLN